MMTLNSFNFNTTSGIRFGSGQAKDSCKEIFNKLGSRILFITDKGLMSLGLTKPTIEELKKMGYVEIFDEVEIIPGISSTQVAASRAKVPTDKSKVITMHISTSIEDKKLELQKALIDGYSVILVPRPWPKVPEKHFMQSEIAKYLKQNGFDTSEMRVHVYESITTENETSFEGTVDQLEGKEFSDLSVMVFNQATLESYINFE